jgi:hypothetical protein
MTMRVARLACPVATIILLRPLQFVLAGASAAAILKAVPDWVLHCIGVPLHEIKSRQDCVATSHSSFPQLDNAVRNTNSGRPAGSITLARRWGNACALLARGKTPAQMAQMPGCDKRGHDGRERCSALAAFGCLDEPALQP